MRISFIHVSIFIFFAMLSLSWAGSGQNSGSEFRTENRTCMYFFDHIQSSRDIEKLSSFVTQLKLDKQIVVVLNGSALRSLDPKLRPFELTNLGEVDRTPIYLAEITGGIHDSEVQPFISIGPLYQQQPAYINFERGTRMHDLIIVPEVKVSSQRPWLDLFIRNFFERWLDVQSSSVISRWRVGNLQDLKSNPDIIVRSFFSAKGENWDPISFINGHLSEVKSHSENAPIDFTVGELEHKVVYSHLESGVSEHIVYTRIAKEQFSRKEPYGESDLISNSQSLAFGLRFMNALGTIGIGENFNSRVRAFAQ